MTEVVLRKGSVRQKREATARLNAAVLSKMPPVARSLVDFVLVDKDALCFYFKTGKTGPVDVTDMLAEEAAQFARSAVRKAVAAGEFFGHNGAYFYEATPGKFSSKELAPCLDPEWYGD